MKLISNESYQVNLGLMANPSLSCNERKTVCWSRLSRSIPLISGFKYMACHHVIWTLPLCENHDPRVKWASKCDPTDNGPTLWIWRLIVHVNGVATYFNYFDKIRNSTIKIIPLYSSLNLYNCQWICKKKELHVNEFPSYSQVKGKTVCL